jgi:hypothetical protein
MKQLERQVLAIQILVKAEKYNHEHTASGEFGVTENGGGGVGAVPAKLPPNPKGLPSASEFAHATLTPLEIAVDDAQGEPTGASEGASGDAFTTTIGGQEYFAKVSDVNAKSEIVASQIARDIGLKNETVPVGILEQAGKQYTVSPFLKGTKQAGELTDKKMEFVAGNISEKTFTKMHSLQVILDDMDRHPGNVLVDPLTDKVTLIDFGYGLTDTIHGFQPKTAALELARSDMFSFSKDPVNAMFLDKGTLAAIAQKSEKIMSYVKTGGFSETVLAKTQKRLSAIATLSQSTEKNVNVGMLQALVNG